MRPTLLAAACAVGLLASPAAAHWQNTRWGMTEAEVRALWPAAFEKVSGVSYYLHIDGPVTVSGRSFKAISFYFDTKGRLRAVHATAPEPYDAIFNGLASQVGAPAKAEDKPVLGLQSHSALFRDTSKGNSIEIFGLTGGSAAPSTTLTYRAIETAF